MVCVYCQTKTAVVNSRSLAKSHGVWRRRQCAGCQALFTTVELMDWPRAVMVKDEAGHLEPFSRDKLLISVHSSLKHRKDAASAATGLTDTVMSKLLSHIDQATLDTRFIIGTVTDVLKRFDKSAAVTYSAYNPATR